MLGGSDGGFRWSEPVAAALATRGFTALALAYFGADGLPSSLTGVRIDAIVGALRELRRAADGRCGPTGILGRSRGGELALQVAAVCAEPTAVVACSASCVRWVGFNPGGGDAGAAWTLHGVALPYLSPTDAPRQGASEVAALALTTSFLDALHDRDRVRDAAIPVERILGPILVLSGQDDRMWPAAVFGEMTMRRLDERGHPYAHQHVVYPDAGHSVGDLPRSHRETVTVVHPLDGQRYLLGGTPAGNQAAARDAWRRLVHFFRTNLHTNAAPLVAEE